MLKESMKSIGSECDVVSFSPLGSKVEEESSIYEYYVTKTETQKLEDKSLYYAFIDFLSFPFFASQILPDNGMGDILFWNEPVGNEIPGNMQIILNHQATRTAKIYVQRKASYERLIELGASPEMVKQLGYLYSFIRENKHRPEVLICTNSDRVAHINELAQLVPGMNFHVAAITEMSSKLMAAGANANVFLYPNVKNTVLDHLFEKCDIYLDINYEGEIVDAVAGHVVAKTPFIGYLSQLCFSVVGIIVTVVIFVAGLGCMMYANKISKEVNQELEDENN